ncbi:hypothetical protein PLESTM_002065500 [Pleodorina starrii]|nr:hypothetical protein PLESTM_002065500 [Pleodorina starrii]
MAACNPAIPGTPDEAVSRRDSATTEAPTAGAPEQHSSPAAATAGPPGSSHSTMLSAFAPAINQATAAAADDAACTAAHDTTNAPGDQDRTPAAPPCQEQPMPVLLWDHTNQSGPTSPQPHTAHSLARVDEDVAALWASKDQAGGAKE